MIKCPIKPLNERILKWADQRGYLEILYEDDNFVLKRSMSHAGVFRGMHWQPPPFSQIKLIRVISGRVMDFVVDPQGATKELFYRQLTSEDGWIQIESHLAHGYYTFEESEFEYMCLGKYNEDSELNFSIADFLSDQLSIRNPILSHKDTMAPKLRVSDGMRG